MRQGKYRLGKAWVMLSILSGFTCLPANSATLDSATVELTQQLSDDSYKVREQALVTLWELGEKSLPALRSIAEGNNPEAKARAEELILHISIGLSPDSPEDLKKLVIDYAEADETKQYVILGQLSKQGYWQQALRLIKKKDPKDLTPNTVRIATQLGSKHSREAILADDLVEAERILDMLPNCKESYMLRAWFYKYVSEKKLAQELRKAESMKGKSGAEWRMALHCINRDTVAALTAAKEAGDTKMVNLLKVFEGDAIPYLTAEFDQQQRSEHILSGWEMQLSRLRGEEAEAFIIANDLLNKTPKNLQNNYDTRVILACLASNGFKNHALEIFEKIFPLEASSYYLSGDDPDASLAVLGIDSTLPAPYSDWIATETKLALEKSSYERLISLALFHRNLGEPEYILDVMSPVMEQLETDDSEDWYKVIAAMSFQHMGDQILYFLNERGNEDGEVDKGLAYFLNSQSKKKLSDWQQEMWSFVKNRNPDDLEKSLHEIALLAGLVEDYEGKTMQLHDDIIASLTDLPDDQQKSLSDSLYNFARTRNDYQLAMTMAEQFAKKDHAWIPILRFFQTKFQQWDKVEAYLAQQVEAYPTNPIYWADWYISLRKLGKEKQAAEALRKMMLIAMMDFNSIQNIARKLNDVGFEAEATSLWETMTLSLPELAPNKTEFLAILAGNSHHYYHSGQWARAAAIKEAYLHLIINGDMRANLFGHCLHTRFYTDFCHGMSLYQKGDKKAGIAKLDSSRKLVSSGALADEFFPAIHKIDIGDRYEKWFEESFQKTAEVCKTYPKAHNSQNTAAWLASRSILRLDEAIEHATAATTLRPTQGAYLDTMAEVWFAKGDRKKAIEWSEKATTGIISQAQGSPMSENAVFANFTMLKKQQNHLLNDPLPKPYPYGN